MRGKTVRARSGQKINHKSHPSAAPWTASRPSGELSALLPVRHVGCGRLLPFSSGERKSLAQIHAPDLYIVPQFMRRTRTKYTPFRNDVCPVRHTQCLPDIVIRNQDPNAAGLEIEDDFL